MPLHHGMHEKVVFGRLPDLKTLTEIFRQPKDAQRTIKSQNFVVQEKEGEEEEEMRQ